MSELSNTFSKKKYLLGQLVKRDFSDKYVGSYLGLAWAILDPLATTVILAVIFNLGFKAGTVQSVPFFVFMFTGMVAFNFFSMALADGTLAITNYSFLVKKVDFQLSLLPIIKVISAFIFQNIMLLILIIVLLINQIYPSWYWLQIFYYNAGLFVLLIGLTMLTSALNVFVNDIASLVNVALKFLFYLTPIFWGDHNIPEQWHYLLKLNPMHYIANGYRESLIFETGFWVNWQEALYFWGVSFVILILGVVVFKKLRPHFADVV